MANLLSEPQQTQILNLHQKGLSQRRIAQELGINRSSVSRYIRRLSKCTTISNTVSASGTAAPGVQTDTSPACLPGPECTTISNTGALVGRHSACLGLEAAIRKKWTLGLSIQRVYQDLQELGFGGSYQSVRRFVAKLAKMESEPLLAPCRALGGVPLLLRLDNLKAAVKRPDWLDPLLNPKFAEFCRHYQVEAVPCRPYHPQHKGKVERNIAYVKDNALKGHEFDTLNGLNAHLKQWESRTADQRIHRTDSLLHKAMPFLILEFRFNLSTPRSRAKGFDASGI